MDLNYRGGASGGGQMSRVGKWIYNCGGHISTGDHWSGERGREEVYSGGGEWGQSYRESSSSGLSYKDREDRARQLRERQDYEKQTKLQELKDQAASAQRFREQQESERRRRLEDMRQRDTDRRSQVEERKRIIQQAEQDRREAVIRKNMVGQDTFQVENHQRFDSKRRNERSNIVFAFGSSTPRMLDPRDSASSYWGTRRATSTTNVHLADTSSANRRSSDVVDTDLSRKRATSAHSLDRKPEGEDIMSKSMTAAIPSAARRRTDLLPTLPAMRDNFGSSNKNSPRHRSPGRAASMGRLDELARPKPRHISPLAPLHEIQSSMPQSPARSISKSMVHLGPQTSSKSGVGPSLDRGSSRSQLALAQQPRMTRAEMLKQKRLQRAMSGNASGNVSGNGSDSSSSSSSTATKNSNNLFPKGSAQEMCLGGGSCWSLRSEQGCEQQYQKVEKAEKELPEDDIAPMNMFVGNLSPNIDKNQLLAALTPGEEGFLRQPLPDRDYDLNPHDPNKSSIHVLVDDVLIKILEYLPLKKIIICELVCRRWQALVYVIFESTTHLNLNKRCLIKKSLIVNDAMISKMLLLTGESLKSLTLYGNYLTEGNKFCKNLFPIIAQLSPNIENLDLSCVPDIYFDDENVLNISKCKNIKSFSTRMCFYLKDNSFKKLLPALPNLEKLDVSHTGIAGYCFNVLPEGLKELNISFCRQIKRENLRKVSKTCRNLEVLEIEYLDVVDKGFLEELGVNCPNLTILKLYIPNSIEVSNQVNVFTKLKTLKIVASTFELPNIVDNLKGIEELHIQVKEETRNKVDFSKFAHLKNLFLICSPFRKQELLSLVKCKSLQEVTIKNCKEADQEIMKKIIRGCLKIKYINCPKVGINDKFISHVDEIMKNRSEPIKIIIQEDIIATTSLFEAQYDTKKIIIEVF